MVHLGSKNRAGSDRGEMASIRPHPSVGVVVRQPRLSHRPVLRRGWVPSCVGCVPRVV